MKGATLSSFAARGPGSPSVLLDARAQSGVDAALCHRTPKELRNSSALAEARHDGIRIVHTSAPRTSADGLKCGPQPCVIGELGMWRQIGMRGPRRQYRDALRRREGLIPFAHEIDGSDEIHPIDDQAHAIALPQSAYRAAS